MLSKLCMQERTLTKLMAEIKIISIWVRYEVRALDNSKQPVIRLVNR